MSPLNGILIAHQFDHDRRLIRFLSNFLSITAHNVETFIYFDRFDGHIPRSRDSDLCHSDVDSFNKIIPFGITGLMAVFGNVSPSLVKNVYALSLFLSIYLSMFISLSLFPSFLQRFSISILKERERERNFLTE